MIYLNNAKIFQIDSSGINHKLYVSIKKKINGL